MQKLLLLLIAAILGGCTVQYTAEITANLASASGLTPRNTNTRLRTVALSPVDSIYVPISINSYRETLRRRLAIDSLVAVGEYFVTVLPGNEPESVGGALRAASELRCGLMFYAEVTRFENQFSSITEVDVEKASGVGFDRLQIQVSIWDVNQGIVIDKAVLNSRSGWLDWQHHEPESLIQSALLDYLDQVVARLPR